MFKKLDNNNGAILILTLVFVLAFTSLGIASIYFATQQNEFTEKLKFSTQAFWLAEAGVQKAMRTSSQALTTCDFLALLGVRLGLLQGILPLSTFPPFAYLRLIISP